MVTRFCSVYGPVCVPSRNDVTYSGPNDNMKNVRKTKSYQSNGTPGNVPRKRGVKAAFDKKKKKKNLETLKRATKLYDILAGDDLQRERAEETRTRMCTPYIDMCVHAVI